MACGGGSPTRPSNPGGGSEPPPVTTPTVSAVTPGSGGLAGGTLVTVTGTNFAAGATVTVGGTAATDVTVVSATSLTARTPARAGTGTADVAVTVNSRTALLANAFNYVSVGQQGGQNAPPTISRIRARGTRPGIPFQFADLGETITVTADVQDAETPLDQLTYEWRATGGTVTGGGPVVQWRAPDSGTREYDIELTVSERYTDAGTNGTAVHRVVGTTRVSVHNSEREIRDMALLFLEDFSKQKSADEILKNFTVSAGCPRGRQNEQNDVTENHRRYIIREYRINPNPELSVRFAGVCRFRDRLGDACVYVPVWWNSFDKDTNQMAIAEGIDQVTAAYEGNRWWLCDSDMIPKGTNGTIVSPFMR